MKKLIILGLVLVTVGIGAPLAEARTTTATVVSEAVTEPQVYRQRRGRNLNRRPRSTIRTRIRRIGRYRYRETLRITYLPNGRTRTKVISRVRLGGRNW